MNLLEAFKDWWETLDNLLLRQLAWIALAVVALYIWVVSIALALAVGEEAGNPFYLFMALYQGAPAPYFPVLGLVGMGFGLGGALLAQQWFQMGVHGRARWANNLDIRRAGMLAEEGLLLGKVRGRYLCANLYKDDGHLQILSPSGSGKGAAFVIPNLLNWKHSALVLDIKGECYQITSGFRKQFGHQVYCWSPAASDGRTVCFNPLDLVRRDPLKRIGDLKDFASLLWPSDSDKGEIWQPGARSIFVAIALEILDNQSVAFTVGNILRKIKTTPNMAEYIEGLVARHFDQEDSGYSLDALALQNFTSFLQQANKEQSGLLSTIKSGLELWEDPIIDAATSRSDFDLRQLRRQKMAIYVSIPMGQLIRLAPLIKLFFQQCINTLTQQEPDENEPYKVLMVLDEFPLLGRMDVFKKGIGFLRSFGVRMMMVAQSKAQVADIYGSTIANQIFSQNCRFVVAYAPNDPAECKEISEALGKKTVRTSSRTYSNGKSTTNVSFTGRELMTPEEVRRFTQHKEIIFPQNHRPVKARKIAYYRDRLLKQRLLPAVDIPVLDIEGHKKQIDQAYFDQLAELRNEAKEEQAEAAAKPTDPAELDQLSQAEKESLVDVFDEIFSETEES